MVKVKNTANRHTSSRAHDADRGARAAAPKSSGTSRILRIIGGKHRGRRLRFPAGVTIRPTPDRVRETLFNWLQPRIAGARVLDLFAGSGALGLEALSRGAAHVRFVEKDRRAASAIDTLISEWQETGAQVTCADALGWLAQSAGSAPFDIVFLDPPYDAVDLDTLVAAGARQLSDAGVLVLEHAVRRAAPQPADVALARVLKSGDSALSFYRHAARR